MRKGFKFSEEQKLKRAGRKVSKETKLKMSLVKLGKKHTKETKIKIGEGNKGKIISEEQKEKLRISRLGKKLSEETIEKIRKAHLGKRNHNWKGGRKLNRDGYVMILKHEHPDSNSSGYIFEHRVLVEEIMGQYLKKQEVVHHINGIRDDNRTENLMLFSNNLKHTIYHNRQKIINYFLSLLIINNLKEVIKWQLYL